MSARAPRTAFTLIELLIVVAIIAILAAIAVPNFLEAQVRAKVSKAKNDMRNMATGLEGYRVDHNEYPEGSDNPDNMSPELLDALGDLAPGFYALRTTSADGAIAGIDFATITTPIAYIDVYPRDPFGIAKGLEFPFAYRNAKDTLDGYIITSFGPDNDLFRPDGRGTTNSANPLSTASDTNSPARLGDINERAVIHVIEGTGSISNADRIKFDFWLQDLSYDPSNGTISDGDIYRKSGVARLLP